MRSFVALTLTLTVFALGALADTYVSGPVSGTWTLAGSPYLVIGDLDVVAGQTLVIEPGVQVKFTGAFRFYVHGTLTAVGTAEQRIVFTHYIEQPTAYWRGLRFINAQGVSELGYCDIMWGYAQGQTGNPDSRGGGVLVESSQILIHHCNVNHNKADVKGGGLFIRDSYAEIAFCAITQNRSNSDGGGILVESCDSTWIHDCQIWGNQANNGGGLHLMFSPCLVEHNQIYTNTAWTSNGGGIMLDACSPMIRYNLISINSATGSFGSGIYMAGYCNPQIMYNEISFNGNAAVSCNNNSNPLLDNNTIYMNNNCGVWTTQNSHPIGHNNIIRDNIFGMMVGQGCSISMAYSNIGGGWPGQGNFDLDPSFVGGIDLHLMPYSPCIDAGSPLSPPDPDSTVCDMGCYYFDQNQPQGTCSVTLAPIGAPIILPPQGGTVWFTVLVQNTPNFYNLFDGWITLQQPDSQIVPLLNRSNLYLPPAGVIARTLSLLINSSAMPGTYTIRAYVGDYLINIEDWDSFTFIKSAGADNSSEPPCVTISDGEITKTVPLKAPVLPSSTRLLGNRPDPFNPTTVLSFELRVPSRVSLKVYDTAGRLVTTLVDGWRQAGEHEVTFDGSGLASGVYVYALQTDGYRSCGKMTLLK
jgi:hypothetical protein